MPTPTIEKLLILQERDQQRLSLDNQVKAVPREIAAVEQKIAAEKAAFEAARGEARELEAKKKAVENEIGAVQDRLARYKSQQLLVRKNDEYQALGVEIDHAQAEIGAQEEEELKVMYAIDEAEHRRARGAHPDAAGARDQPGSRIADGARGRDRGARGLRRTNLAAV
jgi:predicted  nucleic acid-binding Zn-ribbon protein